MTDAPPIALGSKRFRFGAALSVILIASFLLKLHNLDHPDLKPLDEAFHALVAKNLLAHPLTPTLIDRPWIAYDYRDWQSNHVWLHKPILPLWQIAIAFAAMGINTLALRLPSALFATAAVWLTYAIGRELFDRTAGLIAALLCAFSPALLTLVQGRFFSDHVDVAMLFWVELGIWFVVRTMRRGRWSDVALAGTAQAAAFLCKSYPAMIVSAVAVAIAILPSLRLCGREQVRLTLKQAGCIVLIALLTVAPWTIWCLINFRQEFLWENVQVLRHLGTNVEGWAGPWDRVVFDYLLRIYHVLYVMALAAAIVLLVRAAKEKNASLWLTLLWFFGVLIPHTLARSKTPTATIAAWPAGWLLIADMVRRAIKGDFACLGAWAGAAVIGTLWWGHIPSQGWGYPNPPHFAGVMREQIWVLWQLLSALACAAALSWRPPRRAGIVLVSIASVASAVLFARSAHVAWRATQMERDQPVFAELGALVAARLPANAVLLLDQHQKLEDIVAMFRVDRTCYPLGDGNWQDLVSRVRAAGGEPYIVSHRVLPLKVLFADDADGVAVFAPENVDLRHYKAEYPAALAPSSRPHD